MAIYERHSPYGGVRNVEIDDVVTGCYEWLRSNPDLMDLLGHIPGPKPWTPFLYANELRVVLNGLESNAVVIKNAGGWSAPNAHNTAKFPRILVEFYSDPLRDDDGDVLEHNETIRRINYIYDQFDRYLHRPANLDQWADNPYAQGKVQWWGTIRTLECVRLGEFSFNAVPDTDGMLLGTAYYGVQVG